VLAETGALVQAASIQSNFQPLFDTLREFYQSHLRLFTPITHGKQLPYLSKASSHGGSGPFVWLSAADGPNYW
jgi:hypothetical protein